MRMQPGKACPCKILGLRGARAAAVVGSLAALALALVPAGARGAGVVNGRLLVRNAILFTQRADETAPGRGYLLAGDDGKILSVGYGDAPPWLRAARVVDASGKMLVPGFVSAHNHPYQAATRGLATDQALGGWLGEVRPYWVGGPASDHYYSTLLGCYDLLRHGITSGFNFDDGNGEAGVDVESLRAEFASGMRFVHGYCLPIVGTRESRLADFDAFYAYTRPFAGRPSFLGLAMGGYAYATGDRDYMMLEGEIMASHRLFNQAHYLEAADAAQVAGQRAKFRWFRESHELGPRLAFGHLIHADGPILAQIAEAGAGMVWNPLSNGRLGSGVADIPAMRRLGIRIGMGVDGQASADVADPFENMRAGLYAVRARAEDPSVLGPRDVLGFHTLGSADVMGVADRVGSLEKGKYADFLVVDPHAMETGPVVDPYGTLVLACGTANIEAVYVGSRLVVDHGNVLNPDYATVCAEVASRSARLRASLAPAAKGRP
jgi:5-methylthioadenosine/S-adenosylhomocysteine deaminase